MMEKGKRSTPATRGEATLFGFKRPTQPATTVNAPSLPTVDANVTRETIEPLVITPVQARHGTPKLGRAKKNGNWKAPNRFGFRPVVPLSNKVADLQQQETRAESDFRETTRPQSVPAVKLHSSERNSQKQPDSQSDTQVTGKFTLHYSQLPRPQSAVRVPSAPVDKWAKTAANNQTVTRAQQASSAASESGSQKSSDDSVLEIQQLDQSPSMNKFRAQQKSRPIEMVFSGARNKTFDIREVGRGSSSEARDSNSTTSSTTSMPPLPRDNSLVRERRELYEASVARENRNSISRVLSSDEEIGDEGFDETAEEEKQNRDRQASEKDPSRCVEAGESPSEEMWGHGEAMAMEEEMCGNLGELDKTPEAMNPPLRSVLLTIEDPTFATLAAMSNSGMLEDEVSPEILDLSCSPPSVEPLPPPHLAKDESPESPGTPTHATNSLSSDTRERDFLIDDEIADQPGLVFNNTKPNSSMTLGINDPSLLDTPKTIATLAGQVSRVLATISSSSPGRIQELSSTTSVGTLSPCESIASDDLMVDYDRSDASNFEDLNDLDETALKSELENQSGLVLKEWNSILSSHPGLSQGMRSSRLLRSRVGSSGSGGQESPRSRSNLSSPLRTTRMDASSPGDDLSDDSGIRVDRGTYQHMFQDVINIKTMLLRLKRVLQESETINPFDNNLKNGLYYGLASSEAGEETPQQLADLRRQVVLLQHQMEEKDKMISQLQETIARSNEARPIISQNSSTANAATQTDRIRPLSTGPTILQTSPDNSTCSLVSFQLGKETRPMMTLRTARLLEPNPNSSSSENLTHPLSSQSQHRSRVPVGPFRRNFNHLSKQDQDPSKLPVHNQRKIPQNKVS